MDNFQTGTLAILFMSLCIRVNNLIVELADSLLQPTVALETERQMVQNTVMVARERQRYPVPPCNKGYGNPPLTKWVPHMVLC